MEDTRLPRFWTWSAVVFACGVASGWMGRGASPNAPNERTLDAAECASCTTRLRGTSTGDFADVHRSDQRCVEALRLAENQCQRREEAWEMEKSLLVGVPISWNSPNIPESLHPDAVGDSLQKALRECTNISGAQFHLDCSEFPCMLWARPNNGGSPLVEGNDPIETLSSCGAWNYRRGLMSTRTIEDSNGTQIEVAVGDVLSFGSSTAELVDARRIEYRLQTKGYDALDTWAEDTGTP